ncbi:MAG: radical SAM family heme chaperone HemW [bacterium]
MNDLPDRDTLPGLYIHIPICLSKCRYCGFCSAQNVSEDAVIRLMDCLCREMEMSGSEWTVFDTVYWGGGTPSLLKRKHVERLMRTIKTRFDLRDGAEITMEINPGDVSEDNLSMWVENGFNRFSLGVQSLDPNVLRFLGRRHDRDQALTALERLQSISTGINNLSDEDGNLKPVTYSVDLLMGIPGQRFGIYKKTVQTVCEYAPHHLSCYQLTIEPGTPLAEDTASGNVKMVSEKIEADQFEWTHDYLSEHGYRHYEVSNYALGNGHVSRHNLKYWIRTKYLGIGPSAHSFNGEQRWWNIGHLQNYCHRIEKQDTAVLGREQIDDRMERVEKLFLSLRTQWGLNLFEEIKHNKAMIDQVFELVQGGFLVLGGDNYIYPTKKGLSMADAVAERLVACL